MSVELKHHPEEWFFLHNFDIDKVFSTIQRADYLILYYIKMQAEQHPDSKVYLADLAAVMGLKVTELSKAVEKLQDKGFVAWKTDREAGRTYVELSSKAVDLMRRSARSCSAVTPACVQSLATKNCIVQ